MGINFNHNCVLIVIIPNNYISTNDFLKKKYILLIVPRKNYTSSCCIRSDQNLQKNEFMEAFIKQIN